MKPADVIALLLLRVRNRHFLVMDAVLLALTPTLALSLRLDADAWASPFRVGLAVFTVVSLIVKLRVFYRLGMYRRYWRYASMDELYIITLAVGTACGVLSVTFFVGRALNLIDETWLPRSVPLLDSLFTLIVVGGTRFSMRALETARRMHGTGNVPDKKRVLVVGAGDSGLMMVREMRGNPGVKLDPVGFVDDDPRKRGASIYGVPVLGRHTELPTLVAEHHIQEVIIAMPTAPGSVIREIVRLCEAANVSSKIMPGMDDLLTGRVGINHLRNVDIEDLLRREPVQIDTAEVARLLSGACVLITGGGGSIGSELCRQIARCGPGHLIVLGHGENSLFDVENELRLKWPALTLSLVVADIRDVPRMRAVFERARPQIVFHAAAHKHVPLMESNIEDAVTNNIGGTLNLVQLSEQFGVEQFVLISSDKAVNPTNVMGATKRMAEMIVQAAARRTGRPYVAVRFGNVLGSRGSVVPTFREQIARGGPVTITHPDVTRYFMTIPEAVQLVLQASALGTPGASGEVFVLDMGEPVKIIDLARDLIELSGLEVGRDIEIVFTGLRPGDKLFEELVVAGEEYQPTRHAKILLVRDPQHNGSLEPAMLDAKLTALLHAAAVGQAHAVRQTLQSLIPGCSLTHNGVHRADLAQALATPHFE